MIEVTLEGHNTTRIMEIVQELRDSGLRQGVDFDFQYHPPKFDTINGHQMKPKYTIFFFYNNATASWFALKHK